MEWILGDTEDKSNILYWERVKLNLPGSSNYDPRLPWISKVKDVKGQVLVAALLVSYVDDLRVAGVNESDCWKVMHHISSRLGYLGLQFAARKSRPPSLTPGPWAGSVVHTADGKVCVSCTPLKWSKAKAIILNLLNRVDQKLPLNHKELEKDRGFLVHVQHTYPAITPYLKGLHLTIHSWREGRDPDGWKLSGSASQSDPKLWDDDSVLELTSHVQTSSAPKTVLSVPRLRDDLMALSELLSPDSPPEHIIRSNTVAEAGYGFGDASGTGLGSSLVVCDTLTVLQGVWGCRKAAASSNFQELTNLMDTLESGHASGLQRDTEFFLFTDNSTAESVYFKDLFIQDSI